MKDVQIHYLTVMEAGRINLPEGNFVLLQIRNLGTHGAIDTCLINNELSIPGGEFEDLSTYYLECEKDATDWDIQWEATAIDFKVLFVFKLFKD